MYPSDALLQKLLSCLSDGQHRFDPILVQVTGATSSELSRALDILERAGLRFVRSPDGSIGLATPYAALDEDIIRSELARASIRAKISVVALVDSTNTSLLNAARRGSLARAGESMTILAAEIQRAGRGRQGRTWHACAGTSLTVSFAKHLPQGLADLSGLSLVCGLAVREALLQQGVSVQLKWPNDLLYAGKKLGGILVEVHPEAERGTWAVIGVGLNTAADAARAEMLGQDREGALLVTDLAASGAPSPVDRNRIVADIAVALSVRLARFEVAGFSEFSTDWNAHHAYRDRQVELIERGVTVCRGIARGVDASGRLCLDTETGCQSVVAGDVSLRPA